MKTVVPPTFPFFHDKLCIRASSNTGFSPAIRRKRPPKVLASFSPGDSLRFLSLPAPRFNLSSLSFSLFLHFAGQICISRTWSDENIRFWQSQHRNTHRGSVSLSVAFTVDMTNCRPDAQNDVKSIPRTLVFFVFSLWYANVLVLLNSRGTELEKCVSNTIVEPARGHKTRIWKNFFQNLWRYFSLQCIIKVYKCYINVILKL